MLPEFKCRHCAWIGRGSDFKQGEGFRDLFEVCCPACGSVVTTIVFPTVKQSRQNWDKLFEADKAAVQAIEARQHDFNQRKLRWPTQLPDLPGDDLIILWDIEHREGGDTILRHKDDVLWKETSFYEGYDRFVEVGEILVAKYGSRA